MKGCILTSDCIIRPYNPNKVHAYRHFHLRDLAAQGMIRVSEIGGGQSRRFKRTYFGFVFHVLPCMPAETESTLSKT